MNTISPTEPVNVPFPLYHGSSSHYIASFRPGDTVADWPHKHDALEICRRLWTALKDHNLAPEWWQEKILAQDTGPANWQHGQVYVTPSMISAVRYASGGAAHGGELLQSCRDALDKLSQNEPRKAGELLRDAGAVARFLEEEGFPILVEFRDVQPNGLSPERPSDDVGEQLAKLAEFEDREREILGQQINFRLAPGCGVVARVFELSIKDVGDPLSQYELKEIPRSEL